MIISPSSLLPDAISIIREGSQRLIADFGRTAHLNVRQKGPGDLVSDTDVAVEKFLIERLSNLIPDCTLLTEEHGILEGDGHSEWRWIIDPLDGTTNFLRGIPHFCTTIALDYADPQTGDTSLMMGLTYDPIRDELFQCVAGEGAQLNGQSIQVSTASRLEDALLASGTASYHRRLPGEARKALSLVARIAGQTGTMRCQGSAALDLAYVASGRYDGFWHTRLKPWDIAAGVLLIREAGGIVRPLSEGDSLFECGTILASNPAIASRIQNLLLHPGEHPVDNKK